MAQFEIDVLDRSTSAGHTLGMATQPKRPRDSNQFAKLVADIATGEVEDAKPDDRKDPAAVALGRKGGLKGGVARARKLSPQQRSEIAKIAARSRWAESPNRKERMVIKWRKKLTKSDAQEDTKGARMPFLRFTKGSIGEDHTTWFRNVFFDDLNWKSGYSGSGHHKEKAKVKVHVKLPGNDLGIRAMTLDHDPARAGNHRAPTTHLFYDDTTKQALESACLAGHSVVVERDDSGNYSLTVL